jgi:hypothetical protein
MSSPHQSPTTYEIHEKRENEPLNATLWNLASIGIPWSATSTLGTSVISESSAETCKFDIGTDEGRIDLEPEVSLDEELDFEGTESNIAQ